MKMKFFALTAAVAILFTGMSSCVRCVVCVDKDKNEKLKLCDKDYSKADVDNQIKYYETLGNECKKSSAIY